MNYANTFTNSQILWFWGFTLFSAFLDIGFLLKRAQIYICANTCITVLCQKMLTKEQLVHGYRCYLKFREMNPRSFLSKRTFEAKLTSYRDENLGCKLMISPTYCENPVTQKQCVAMTYLFEFIIQLPDLPALSWSSSRWNVYPGQEANWAVTSAVNMLFMFVEELFSSVIKMHLSKRLWLSKWWCNVEIFLLDGDFLDSNDMLTCYSTIFYLQPIHNCTAKNIKKKKRFF